MKENYRKYFIIIFILISGIILFRAFAPMFTGLLGAFTVYMLVRRQMFYFTEKRKLNKTLVAILLLFEVLLCVLVPTFLMVWMLLYKLQNIDLDISGLIAVFQEKATFVQDHLSYDLFSADNIKILTSFATTAIQVVVGEVSSFVINAAVLLFILYFMLTNGRRMEAYIADLLPFNEKNKRNVLRQVHSMVVSNAIGIPLLAVIQGIAAFIGYLIFGVPNALLLAFITCFATIIPLVGTAVVWIPACLYLGLTGNWWLALGLAVFCVAILTNVDNAVRFFLQKKMADTHPLITVFGVIIGISLFGFWGIIFGPLLLSMFFLCVDIFKTEYLDRRG
jgi:predicted PurR-regulated permease PerM